MNGGDVRANGDLSLLSGRIVSRDPCRTLPLSRQRSVCSSRVSGTRNHGTCTNGGVYAGVSYLQRGLHGPACGTSPCSLSCPSSSCNVLHCLDSEKSDHNDNLVHSCGNELDPLSSLETDTHCLCPSISYHSTSALDWIVRAHCSLVSHDLHSLVV